YDGDTPGAQAGYEHMKRSRYPHTTEHRAFTLVELLVVVTLIILLIAILLPALAAARNAARVSSCLSNMHQLGVAIQAYGVDEKHQLPVGPGTGTDPSMGVTWNKAASTQIWIGDNAPFGG